MQEEVIELEWGFKSTRHENNVVWHIMFLRLSNGLQEIDCVIVWFSCYVRKQKKKKRRRSEILCVGGEWFVTLGFCEVDVYCGNV